MIVKKYKEKDVLPLTMGVLHDLRQFLVIFTLKFVIDNLYPDLKGIIDIETFDESSEELLKSGDIDLFEVTLSTSDALAEAVLSLENIYGHNLEEIAVDKRYKGLIGDFISYSVIYDLPNEPDSSFNLSDLGFYSVSMLNTLNLLCHLLCDLAVDFNRAFRMDEFFFAFFVEQDFSGEKYANVLYILQDLGIVIQDNQKDTLAIMQRYKGQSMA